MWFSEYFLITLKNKKYEGLNPTLTGCDSLRQAKVKAAAEAKGLNPTLTGCDSLRDMNPITTKAESVS